MRLFGRVSLPFFAHVSTAYASETRTVHYEDTEVVRLAGIRMQEALSALLSKGAFERISTGGEWTEEGYALYTEYVQNRQVCESVPVRLVGEG